MSNLRLIKKYPNRRLYDTEQSKYITLPQVRELITKNTPFKVVDSQSDEDLTRSILLQIIIEQESETEPLFSNDALERFIRYYNENSRQGFSQFIDQSLQFFHEQQEQIQDRMKEFIGQTPLQFWNDVGDKNMEMWRNMQNDMMKAFNVPADTPKSSEESNNPDKNT